ncbi:hypothetical protein PAMP_002004 [Pampus punctatissimus]
MEVLSSAMGPERVLPSSEDEDERPADGDMLPVGAVWSGGGGGEEEEEEEGGGIELDGEEEEEEEEVNSGGYYYQPLNQEPDGLNASAPEEEEEEEGEEEGEGESPSHAEQLQQVQQRIEVKSTWQQLTHKIMNTSGATNPNKSFLYIIYVMFNNS